MAVTKHRFTWRVSKITGMIRSPKLYTLHVDGKPTDMTIQSRLYGDQYFWYGCGRNTCGRHVDLKTAKAQALEHFKKVRGYNQ